MYYSYVEFEYVATSFSPARTDLAVKLLMIILFIFNDVALFHSMLANVSTSRSRGWGTMAAVVRRRPPWFIVFS
jgi:hypothetical protein